MTTATDPTTGLAVNDVAELVRGFELSLRARNRSPKTIKGYVETARLFRGYLVRVGMPTAIDAITREHVEAFIAVQLERWKPKSAQVRYGDLRQFFRWAGDDGEITSSPMMNMKPPTVPETPVPVVGDDDLKRLLKACEGKDFEDKRDLAILRLFIDCGVRLGELSGLSVDDLDYDLQVILVVGKGRRPRSVPFGAKAGQSVEKYMRLRKAHAFGSSQKLWLGPKGPMTDSGIVQILRRRCDKAGIAQVHPHQLRHTAGSQLVGHGRQRG